MKSMIYPAALSLIIAACAHNKMDAEVSREAADQPNRSFHGEVAFNGFDTIVKSQSLTQEQKDKLLNIHKKTMTETMAIQDETSKLKGVLFETLAQSPYNSKKMAVVVRRLKKLNQRKMDNMFQALKESENILSSAAPEDRKVFLRNIFLEPYSSELN